jgi:hypothetical protein
MTEGLRSESHTRQDNVFWGVNYARIALPAVSNTRFPGATSCIAHLTIAIASRTRNETPSVAFSSELRRIIARSRHSG